MFMYIYTYSHNTPYNLTMLILLCFGKLQDKLRHITNYKTQLLRRLIDIMEILLGCQMRYISELYCAILRYG